MSTDLQIHEISLTTLTYGGEAMGRLADGRAVFVPFALPGEVVKARLVDERKNFARAELLEVLKPSPDRIQPRCRHFGACGGCHYQNLPYPKQLEAKQAILRDQLTRIGKIQDPPVRKMVAAPDEWHYRNHVQFHLDETGQLGFIAAGNSSPLPKRGQEPPPPAVLPITECFLPQANLNALWPLLQFDAESPVERISLRAGLDDDLLVVLESDWPETPEMEIEADISVVHLTDDDAVVLAGNDHIAIQVGTDDQLPSQRAFKVSAASFFQVNTAMAAKMTAHLLASLPISPSITLLDVYCGVGLFSAFFAPKVRRVIGIEVAPSACEDFAVNLDEFDNVELYEAPAEDVLPVLEKKPDIVIIDPPRAGLDKKALDALLSLQPQILAYVSCDPSTLARDASRLISGGYKLTQVTPFDLFPQTYHIESISLFERQ